MRLIVRNRQSLHIWNVKDYIKQTQANIIKQDTNKYITMQNIFRKLYLRHLQDHQKLKTHQKTLDNFVMMSQAPARAITDYFHTKSKQYSETFMTATFESLAKAYQISKNDNSGSLDTLGYKLFLSSQFANLSEQLKYALRNNKIQFKNIVDISESLLKLEYVDNEIINLIILYTKRQINAEDPYSLLKNWSGDREFQIEKNSYYNPIQFDTLQSLRKSEEVNTAISFVKHIYEQWNKEHDLIQNLKKHSINQINALVDEVSATNKNFRKLVQSIINIRRQYLKMAEFSGNDQILKNPNLNLELLDLQEKLMAVRLLSIEDIKNPKEIQNQQLQVKRVEEIILSILDIHKLDPIFAFIDKSRVEVINKKEEHLPNPSKISKLLNILSRFAQLDRFVYHSANGRSLVNLKWQKTLIPQQQGNILSSAPIHQELNVSRIYRRVYQEVLSMFRDNTGKLTKIFKRTSFGDKIQFIDSFCRIGLSQYAIDQLSSFDNYSFPDAIHALTKPQFTSLVHLLNDIGIFLTNDSIKSITYAQIQSILQKEQKNQQVSSLKFSIDVVNYLLQNHRHEENFQSIYDRELKLLEEKAIYVTHEEKDNETIIEAFKILALQKPDSYGTHPIYLNYLHRFVHEQFKKNPYHSILRQACFKWVNKERSLASLQNYLTVGVNNGKQNGVVFSSSDQTSVDGQIRTGNLNSYIIRLQTKNKVKINEFSINSFLQINYAKQNIFQLKSIDLLRQRLNNIFEYQHRAFEQIYDQLAKNILNILQVYPTSIITDRIRFKLAILDKIRSNSPSIETKEQEYSNKAQFLLQILELSKLLAFLDQSQILKSIAKAEKINEPLNQKLQKKISLHEQKDFITTDIDYIKDLMRRVKNAVPQLIESIRTYLNEETLKFDTSNSRNELRGLRQTIQVFEPLSSADLTLDFINLRYYNDKTYCEYKDWRERINNRFQYTELAYKDLSSLTKILVNKLCGDVTNKINLLPICKHSDRVQRLEMSFKIFDDSNPNKALPTTKQESPTQSKELDYIINLQNFKHEIKTFYSPKKIIEYIFSFKFIHELHNRTPDKNKLLLTRNPEDYFNYLQELNDRTYLESPYAKYIISKLAKTDNIRQLLEERKILRINLRSMYQKGLIDGNAYYAKINETEDKIIEALKDLKTKMLDHMEDTLLDGEFKMIQIKKEQLQAFEELINKQFNYSRYFDEDFVVANGDYGKALNFKRGRAQINYIKFFLLKKISENQSLNSRERQLLDKWHEDITKNVNNFVTYSQFTTLQISDLSWEDLQLLKLKSSALNVNKDMLLIDLILQFNHFLDQSLINAYERQVKADYISKHFKIPAFLFEKTNSSSFKKLEIETETAIVNQKSKLSPQQLDKVQQLFKIYKTEGYKERNRYADLCKHFKENITQMNNQTIRNELIEVYIKHLEDQFFVEYNPALVQQIKQKETDKLWREVFRQTYDNSNRDLLKQTTKKIILRLEVIGKNPPPFFGKFLLNLLLHPNIDSLSRESLIAAIQLNNFDLNIDSADIEMISKLQGKSLRQSTTVKHELKCASSSKVGKQLRQKVRALVG